MPTYEYECSRGCRFEIEQSIKDDALKRCPKSLCPRGAGGVSVHRLIQPARFILKGGGWYADGYSKGGARPKDGASDSGGDAKPASGNGAAKSSESPSKSSTSTSAAKD